MVTEDAGYTWKQIIQIFILGGRAYHTTTAYFKKLFVFVVGQAPLQKCSMTHRSEDIGKTWEQMTSAAPWQGRYRHMGMSVPVSKTLDSGIGCFWWYQSGTSKWFDDMWVSMTEQRGA